MRSKLTAISQVVLPIVLLIIVAGCKKNDLTAPAINGSFQIREVIVDPSFWHKETYDSDKIATQEAEFIADEPDGDQTSFAWKVGTDARTFTKRKFSLSFIGTNDTQIDVKLTVTKTLPAGEVKTVTSLRKLTLKGIPEINGRFEGYFEGYAQKTTVTINTDYHQPNYYSMRGVLISSGLPKFDTLFSCEDWGENIVLNRRVYFDFASSINTDLNKKIALPNGEILLGADKKTIKLNMTVLDLSTQQRIPMKFNGTRI